MLSRCLFVVAVASACFLPAMSLQAQLAERTETTSLWPDGDYVLRELGGIFAADGDSLILSLKNDADSSDGGTVVFMEKDAGMWSEISRFGGPTNVLYHLGSVVAIDGDRALAQRFNVLGTGEVFFYEYSSILETWASAVAVPLPSGATATFGASLAINGAYFAIGDPSANRVWVYKDTGSDILLVQELTSPDLSPVSFGSAIDMSEDLLVVGDPDAGEGRVDIFEWGAEIYVHDTQVQHNWSFLDAGDEFGALLSIDGDTLAIGAPSAGPEMGGAFAIFRRSISSFTRVLSSYPPGASMGYPASLDTVDGMVIMGHLGYETTDVGSAFIFRLVDGTWQLVEQLELATGEAAARVGTSVAFSADDALVGAPFEYVDVFGSPLYTGRIASFSMDCDGDGVLNHIEISDGTVSDYNANGLPDDCDSDEYVVVPRDFATIQEAVDGAFGRTILVDSGTYDEAVVIDGVDTDIRALDPSSLPVLNYFEGSGTAAIDVSGASLNLENIVFDSVFTGVRGSNEAEIVATGCSFLDTLGGVDVVSSSFDASSCLFDRNSTAGGGGAAIRSIDSELDLNSCDFTNNGGNTSSAINVHEGGAIQASGGRINASDCLFEGNTAEVDHFDSKAAPRAFGGAVYHYEPSGGLQFSNCQFLANLAYCGIGQVSPGSPPDNFARGGAVHASGVTDLLVFDGCVFADNEVRILDSGGQSYAFYADLYVDGSLGSSVVVTQSTAYGSKAQTLSLLGELGVPSTTTPNFFLHHVESVTFTSNSFSDMLWALEWSEPIDGDTSFIGAASSFTDCGLVRISNVVHAAFFSTTDFIGTRLVMKGGDITACNFDRIGPTDLIIGPGDEELYAVQLGGSSAVINCTFHQVYTDYVLGGGSVGSPLQLQSTTICGNDAPAFTDNDLWENVSSNVIEGGANGAASCGAITERTVPGDYATIAEAVAETRNGDSIVLGSGTYEESVDLRGFENVELRGADGANALIRPPAGSPGIRLNGSLASLSNLTIADATTGIDAERGVCSFDNLEIYDCVGECGGAIRLGSGRSGVAGDGATGVLTDSIIHDNNSTGDGGGICVLEDASLLASSCTLEANTADNDGGAIFAADGAASVELLSSVMRFNAALNDGGAIRTKFVELTEVTSCSFQDNTAGRFGGGGALDSAEVTGCSFVGNIAGAVGGGMRSAGTSVVDGCTFQLNVALLAGGLAATAIETYVENFTACGNLGGDYYGNLLTLDGSLLYCSSDCNANGIPDTDEIEAGTVDDCNANGVPDECEDLSDVDGNGIPDECDPDDDGRSILLGSLGSVGGLPLDAVDLLARPLFRNGERTHDILVLSPSGEGELLLIASDAEDNYLLDSTLAGPSFERCCTGSLTPECRNNGPADGACIEFARGDVVISHEEGNTGLFDEDLEMYYACNAPTGPGLPESITDYALAPNSESVISVVYTEEAEGEGGLARAAQPKKKQVIASKGKGPVKFPESGPVAGRHGSGQGGTGPYPGEDAVDDFGLSITEITTGDFNGDGNDDLVVLHPNEQQISIRNFTGLADYTDDDGVFIPSGATWGPPTFLNLPSTPLGVIAGDFVNLPGSVDDGLDDIFVVREHPTGILAYVYASSGPNTLTPYVAYIIGLEATTLDKTTTGIGEEEVILLAGESLSTGLALLYALAQDPGDGVFTASVHSFGLGTPRAVSSTPMRFGASPRRVISALIETADDSEVHFVEIGERPRVPAPANDECSGATVVLEGANAFSTSGATNSDAPLEEACQSDGEDQPYADTWYSWTASASGEAMVSTCGAADFDTWLVAYEGDCAGAVVGCNDQSEFCSSNTSRMIFDVIEGTTYLLRVGSWESSGRGSGTLTIVVPNLPADLNGDGEVNGADLATLLGNWGLPGPTDINNDGTTDGADLTLLLAAWSS